MELRYGKRWAALAACLVLAWTPARAQFVGTIFIVPCQANIPVFSTQTFEVLVCLEGPIFDGVTAAEFRINGLPNGWTTLVRPNPEASVVSGDLFGAGARIAFPACEAGNQPPLLELFEFDLTPTDDTRDVLINVAATIPPDPELDCALVRRCDASMSKTCVNGFGAWINGGGCPLAVESVTWGRVKALYDHD